MGKLKAIGITGLAIILAGIMGFSNGCAKKKPNYDLNNELWYASKSLNLLVSVDGKEGALREKDDFSLAGNVANLFKKGMLRAAQGKEDSARFYFNQGISNLKNSSDTVRNAGATAILLGPVQLYLNYEDSLKKYLQLAEVSISEKTPEVTKFHIYNGLGKISDPRFPNLAISYYKKAIESLDDEKKEFTETSKINFKAQTFGKMYGLSSKGNDPDSSKYKKFSIKYFNKSSKVCY